MDEKNTKYQLSNLPDSKLGAIGAPLALTAVFCFGFILSQPTPVKGPGVQATNSPSPMVVTRPAVTELKFKTQEPLPVLNTGGSGSNSLAESVNNSINTASPQAASKNPSDIQSNGRSQSNDKPGLQNLPQSSLNKLNLSGNSL